MHLKKIINIAVNSRACQMNNQINLTAEEQAKLELVLDGRNKASISTAQWFAFVSPFERFRHCTIEVLYKV